MLNEEIAICHFDHCIKPASLVEKLRCNNAVSLPPRTSFWSALMVFHCKTTTRCCWLIVCQTGFLALHVPATCPNFCPICHAPTPKAEQVCRVVICLPWNAAGQAQLREQCSKPALHGHLLGWWHSYECENGWQCGRETDEFLVGSMWGGRKQTASPQQFRCTTPNAGSAYSLWWYLSDTNIQKVTSFFYVWLNVWCGATPCWLLDATSNQGFQIWCETSIRRAMLRGWQRLMSWSTLTSLWQLLWRDLMTTVPVLLRPLEPPMILAAVCKRGHLHRRILMEPMFQISTGLWCLTQHHWMSSMPPKRFLAVCGILKRLKATTVAKSFKWHLVTN